MTKPGREWNEYKEDLTRAFDLHLFAKAYGYTPDQVRGLSQEDYLTLKILESGEDNDG